MQMVPDSAANQSFPWQWPVLPAGPSWNIPRISLPGCMGPLLQYQNEWWYYAGYARDSDNNRYSLQFSINRFSLNSVDPSSQVIACMTGIGNETTNIYTFNTAYGIGVLTSPSIIPPGLYLPTVTDTSYIISTNPLIGSTRTQVQLINGCTGTVGSQYLLISSSEDIAVNASAYNIELQLTDERGMIMEWQSAYIGPNKESEFGASSFEFAQPRLHITSGAMTLNGISCNIVDGMLWLDRQVITNPPVSIKALLADLLAQIGKLARENIIDILTKTDLLNVKPLYTGTWMGMALNNGLSFVCSNFWQKAKPGAKQWQTGTLLNLPPIKAYGNLYFNIAGDGSEMRNGGSFLKGIELNDQTTGSLPVYDFDVNIFNSENPDQSPHWQSPLPGNTEYANAWIIRINPKWMEYGMPETLYIKALVSGCENTLPSGSLPVVSAFWEGDAIVYADVALTIEIGHVFVEQMGFNQQNT